MGCDEIAVRTNRDTRQKRANRSQLGTTTRVQDLWSSDERQIARLAVRFRIKFSPGLDCARLDDSPV